MNTLVNPLDLVVDAAIVAMGVIVALTVRYLIRDRRERARKRADPRLITLSRDFGAVRPNARFIQQGRSRA
jgi:hypothetical protein